MAQQKSLKQSVNSSVSSYVTNSSYGTRIAKWPPIALLYNFPLFCGRPAADCSCGILVLTYWYAASLEQSFILPQICCRLFLRHTGMQRVCSKISFCRILRHLGRRLKVCRRSLSYGCAPWVLFPDFSPFHQCRLFHMRMVTYSIKIDYQNKPF